MVLHVLNFSTLLHPRLILFCLLTNGTLEQERLLSTSGFRVAFVTDFNVGEVVAVWTLLTCLRVAHDLVFALLRISDLLNNDFTFFFFFFLSLQICVLLSPEDLLRSFSVSNHHILRNHELLLSLLDINHLLLTPSFLDFTFLLSLFAKFHHVVNFDSLCLVSFLYAVFLQLEKLDSILHLGKLLLSLLLQPLVVVHLYSSWIHDLSVIYNYCLALGSDHARVTHWTKWLRFVTASITGWVSYVFWVLCTRIITGVVPVELSSFAKALVASTLTIVLGISHLLSSFKEWSSLHTSWVPSAKRSLTSGIRVWPIHVAVSALLPITSFRRQHSLIQSLHPRVSRRPTVWTLGTNLSWTRSCPRFTRWWAISTNFIASISFRIWILVIRNLIITDRNELTLIGQSRLSTILNFWFFC